MKGGASRRGRGQAVRGGASGTGARVWRQRGAAMSGAALGKAAVAAAARPRRKVLSAEEAELFELAQAAGSGLDPEVFK